MDGMDGWSLGWEKYRAAYAANNIEIVWLLSAFEKLQKTGETQSASGVTCEQFKFTHNTNLPHNFDLSFEDSACPE